MRITDNLLLRTSRRPREVHGPPHANEITQEPQAGGQMPRSPPAPHKYNIQGHCPGTPRDSVSSHTALGKTEPRGWWAPWDGAARLQIQAGLLTCVSVPPQSTKYVFFPRWNGQSKWESFLRSIYQQLQESFYIKRKGDGKKAVKLLVYFLMRTKPRGTGL